MLRGSISYNYTIKYFYGNRNKLKLKYFEYLRIFQINIEEIVLSKSSLYIYKLVDLVTTKPSQE